jgi:group I intron endonuclease
MIPGIYTITCRPTGRVYVGQARRIQERWRNHQLALGKGEHGNPYLQRAWNKYGADAFDWAVAEDMRHIPECDLAAALSEAEVRILKLHPRFFNLMEAGQLSLIASAETRAKLSAERLARWSNDEYRERVTTTMREVSANPEFQSRRGASISAAMADPEYRAQRSETSLKMWADPIFKAARSAERSANWQDPEYRANQQASRAAVWTDEEVRQRRLAGMRASWADPEIRAKREANWRAKSPRTAELCDVLGAFLEKNRDAAFSPTTLWTMLKADFPEFERFTAVNMLKKLCKDGRATFENGDYQAASD